MTKAERSVATIGSAMRRSYLYSVLDARVFSSLVEAVERSYEYVESVGGSDLLSRIRSTEELFTHSVSTAAGVALMYAESSEQERIVSTACALLHDIGKTFVDSATLYKRGSLTQEEFETVKTHAHRGAAYVALTYTRSGFFARVAVTALYHHERPKRYSYLPNLSSVPGSDILPKRVDDLSEADSALLDAVSISDSLSAVCDERSYKAAEPERIPGLLIELRNMCGRSYLTESSRFVSAVAENIRTKDSDSKGFFSPAPVLAYA